MEKKFKTLAFRKFHATYWLIAGSALFISGLSQGPFIVSLTRNVYFTVAGVVLTYGLAVVWRRVPIRRFRNSLLLFLAAYYALGMVLTVPINPITYGQLGIPLDQLTWRHIFAGSMNFGLVMLFWAVLFYFLFDRRSRDSARQSTFGILAELMVEHKGRALKVSADRISHLKAAGDYVEVHMVDGKTYLKRATIGSLHHRLGSSDFLKIHRSTVISRSSLAGLESSSKGSYVLVMDNGERLQTSRRYRATVKQLLGDSG